MKRSTRVIKGVVFDMDGTLCLPQNYMFQEMRQALGITRGTDILDHVHSLPSQEEEVAQLKLQAIERSAMLKMEAQPGIKELFDWLAAKDVPTTILTRNFPIPVNYLLQKFLHGYKLGPVLTREFKPPKPAPDGLLAIADAWKVDPHDLVMVGDSIDDVMAGHRAGAMTVLLRNEVNDHLASIPETDFVIDRLPDLINVLRQHLVEK